MKSIQLTLVIATISALISCKKDNSGPKATISTDATAHVLTRSADVYGSITVSGVDSIYLGVCWSTHIKPEITDSVKFTLNFSPFFHLKMTHLSVNTKYYCRTFVGYNNRLLYGNVLEFHTCTDKVTDFDGNIYDVVDIADQAWMAENLRTTHTRQGSPLKGMWYGTQNNIMPNREADMDHNGILNSNDSLIYVNKFGLLYTWTTANNDVCPDGWHLPTRDEWTEIRDSTGYGYETIANELKSTTGWNNNKNGSDSFGFNVLPAGLWHDQNSTHCFTMGNEAYFWTSTAENVNGVNITIDDHLTTALGGKEMAGFSVRCVKDGDE